MTCASTRYRRTREGSDAPGLHQPRHGRGMGSRQGAEDDSALPTQARWERACRAGSDTARSFGDDERLRVVHAWTDLHAERRPQPVARLLTSPWGLHDQHGDVREGHGDSRTGGRAGLSATAVSAWRSRPVNGARRTPAREAMGPPQAAPRAARTEAPSTAMTSWAHASCFRSASGQPPPPRAPPPGSPPAPSRRSTKLSGPTSPPPRTPLFRKPAPTNPLLPQRSGPFRRPPSAYVQQTRRPPRRRTPDPCATRRFPPAPLRKRPVQPIYPR